MQYIHDERAPDTTALTTWRDSQGGPGYDTTWTYIHWMVASGRDKDNLDVRAEAMHEVNFALHREIVVSVGRGRFRFLPDQTGVFFVADPAQTKIKGLKTVVCSGCGQEFKQKNRGQIYCSTKCNAVRSNHRAKVLWRDKHAKNKTTD